MCHTYTLSNLQTRVCWSRFPVLCRPDVRLKAVIISVSTYLGNNPIHCLVGELDETIKPPATGRKATNITFALRLSWAALHVSRVTARQSPSQRPLLWTAFRLSVSATNHSTFWQFPICHVDGDRTGYFKPKTWCFSNPYRALFVAKPNQDHNYSIVST